MRIKNNKAFTLPEFLVALSVSILFFASVCTFFILIKQFYAVDIAGGNLQRDANLTINKIIKGNLEPGGIFRLSEAASYSLTSINEVHFFGTDGKERWFKLSGNGASVIYHHPTFSGTQDEVLYTVPQGATLTLRFWIPSGSVYSSVNLGIDVGISQTVTGKTISGSATTLLNIRNHSS